MEKYKNLLLSAEFNSSPPDPFSSKKGKPAKLYLHNLEITITHPRNSIRRFQSGKDVLIKPTTVSYGYINHTKDRDNEHVDVFIGPNPESQIAFIVEFLTPSGKLDETKIIIGVNNIQQARNILKENYSENFYNHRIGRIFPILIKNLKDWLVKKRPYSHSRRRKQQKRSFVETELDKQTLPDQAFFAPGIPSKKDFGLEDLEKIKPGEKLVLVLQKHKADRAGEHFDLRIGKPEIGLISWAVRKGLPNVGEKHLAVLQPRHLFDYKDFSGRIESGYGKGEVEKIEEIPVFVTKKTEKTIHLTTADRHPRRFTLVNTDGKNFLLVNSTPTKRPPFEKQKYRAIARTIPIEELLEKLPDSAIIEPKLDGALSIIELDKGDLEIFSHRISRTTGRPIVHTERFFLGKRPSFGVPFRWHKTVLLGEMVAVDRNGRVLPPNELSALLNSSLEKTLEKAKQKGIKFKMFVFDTFMVDGQPLNFLNTDYQKRIEIIKKVLDDLGIEDFTVVPYYDDKEKARKMIYDIFTATHPLTREGVVIHPPRGVPIKYKAFDEADVYVKEIFRGQGKFDNAAGGIIYSLTPNGPAVGRVGTGLTDEIRQLLLEDPDSFKNRSFRIAFTEKLPSGAFRNPVFLGFNDDRN